MRIEELAEKNGIRIVLARGGAGADVARVFAANTISGLLANASADCLLVTALANAQLARVAEIMDAPGICLVDSTAPGEELLAAARQAGSALLVSPLDLERTRRGLEGCLGT
jgi:hypothetical protein